MDELFLIDPSVHGRGPVRFAWHPNGELLATTGANRVVNIFDCHGRLVDQVTLAGGSSVSALEWEPGGHVLAVGHGSAATVTLWNSRSRRVRTLDISNGCGSRDVTFLQWSRGGDHLAAGTGKGVLCIYNRRLRTRVWATGKHKRRILCGAWSAHDRLAYASEDRQISICTQTGDTHDQVKVKCKPMDVAFGGRQRNRDDGVVSVNMEGRTILLYHLADQDNALELAFQARYGSIVGYAWFGDGHVLAAFSNGFVVVISTHIHEIAREQCCVRFHADELTAAAHCPATRKLATCGGNCVKLIDLHEGGSGGGKAEGGASSSTGGTSGGGSAADVDSAAATGAASAAPPAPDLQEVKTHYLDKEAGQLTSLGWSADGKLLSVASRSGTVYTYVVRSGSGDVTHLYPNPALARAMRPLPLLQLAAHVAVVAAALAAVAAARLGVPVAELLKAALWDPGAF